MTGSFTINEDKVGRARYRVEGKLNGKRIRRFFRTREQAEVFQKNKNIELKNHGVTAAGMPAWLRAEAMRCHELLSKIGATLSDATGEYLRNHDQVAKSVSVKKAVELYNLHLATRVEERSIKEASAKTTAGCLKRFSAHFGDILLCNVTAHDINGYLNGLKRHRDGLSLATAAKNSHRTNISQLFTYALTPGLEWIKSNPMPFVAIRHDHKAHTKPVEILSVAQAARLLETAPSHLMPNIALGLFAGLRPAETHRLDWSEIYWDQRIIDVKSGKSKTAQQRDVPINDTLLAWLAPYRKAHGLVSPHQENKTGILKVCTEISAAAKTAGCPKWPKDGLRHSFGSYEFARSENEAQTAAWMGHSVKVFRKHYKHRVRKEQGHAFFDILPAAGDKIVAMA